MFYKVASKASSQALDFGLKKSWIGPPAKVWAETCQDESLMVFVRGHVRVFALHSLAYFAYLNSDAFPSRAPWLLRFL